MHQTPLACRRRRQRQRHPEQPRLPAATWMSTCSACPTLKTCRCSQACRCPPFTTPPLHRPPVGATVRRGGGRHGAVRATAAVAAADRRRSSSRSWKRLARRCLRCRRQRPRDCLHPPLLPRLCTHRYVGAARRRTHRQRRCQVQCRRRTRRRKSPGLHLRTSSRRRRRTPTLCTPAAGTATCTLFVICAVSWMPRVCPTTACCTVRSWKSLRGRMSCFHPRVALTPTRRLLPRRSRRRHRPHRRRRRDG